MPKQPKCYVHLGRFGDLIILLPGWKREFDQTGIKPVVMVADEFASVFDGVSYVQPWVERLQFCAEARKAKAMAEAQFEQVIFPRWWDIGQPPVGGVNKPTTKVIFQGQEFSLASEDWVSHQISQWQVAGFDTAGLREWPLVFDRRDLRRESDLAKSVFKTNKPKLLLNLRGLSSPFAAVPEIMGPMDGLKSRFEFVDLSIVRAERIYDLLGLIDRAAMMITVDTATLHLTHASKTPHIALVVDGARGSVPKGNCKLAVRYADAPEMAGKIFAETANVLQSVPIVIEETIKPKKRSCWMIPKSPSIAIAYLYPCDARETFVQFAKRWADSYRRFTPTIEHDVIVSMSNGTPDDSDFEVFKGIPAQFNVGYNGGGWDIGNFQHIAKVFNHDLVVFMNSRAFFWRDGWLGRFIEARERFGPDGLYGVMASFESCPIVGTFPAPNPHIRTSCFATSPKVLRRFPHVIDSREQSFKFESGIWNVSDWYAKQGLPVKMVAADGFYDRHEWRKPPNIFRRGDQSNCLISDRHTLLYAEASEAEKQRLAAASDAGNPVIPVRNIAVARQKTITVVAATSLNASGHAKAIERTAAAIPHPCEKLLISSGAAPGFTGKHVPLPEPWAQDGKWTLDDMCDFLLSGIFKYIDTDCAIIVHDDGYALNPSKWTNDFLSYDYVGSPWPRHFRWTTPQHRVGNGGFSLRSKRWLERAASLPKLPCGTSEDVYCGVTNVDHFIRAGLRIAPLGVAMKWGMEHPISEFPRWKLSDSFGFHGLTTQDPARKTFRLH